MKIVEEKNVVTTNLENQAVAFKMNASPTAYKILSDGLYKNKIGSIIRELLSNAYDSQKEAGNDVPIKIVLPSMMNQQFVIRDFGTGLSDDDMKEVYTTYFLSTKSNDNKYIGGFGLGSKTPLCYNKEQFGVCSYYNGWKTSYLVYVENGVPTLQEMFKEETTEHNGLEISIGVEKSDIPMFISELKKFLSWVSFKVDVQNSTEEYDYNKKITKISVLKDVYMISPLNDDFTQFSILINGIHYPILMSDLLNDSYENLVLKNIQKIKEYVKDYCGLDIDDKVIIKMYPSMYEIRNMYGYSHVGIVVDIPIGTIDLTASRENISYTERSKQELVSKYLALQLVAGYYPCYMFAKNKKEKTCIADNTDLEIFKKYSKLMCIYKYSVSNLENLCGVHIPMFAFGDAFQYASDLYFENDNWYFTYNPNYTDVLLPSFSDAGKNSKYICVKDNKHTELNLQAYNDHYDECEKYQIGIRCENKPINVIVSRYTIKTFMSKYSIPDGYYLYVQTSLVSKDDIKNDILSPFNLVDYEKKKQIVRERKKKCTYNAFYESYLHFNPLFDKTDVIDSYHSNGADIYYLPCSNIVRDGWEYEDGGFAKLISKCLPAIEKDQERLIVFVSSYKEEQFKKHYPYAISVLDNKNFVKAIKHIIYMKISLNYSSDRDIFINKNFDTKRYNIEKSMVFYNNWNSYKKYIDKNADFCKWLQNCHSESAWFGGVNRLICDKWYKQMPFLKKGIYNYCVTDDILIPAKILRSKKLFDYCLDVLTYIDNCATFQKEFFAKIIRKLKTKGF